MKLFSNVDEISSKLFHDYFKERHTYVMPGSQSGEYYKGKSSPIRQRHRKLMATHKLIQNIA